MSHDTHSNHGSTGYEKKDVNVPMLLWVSAAIVLIIIVSVIWVDQFVTLQHENAAFELRLKPENPQLLELRALEERELGAVKVVDSTRGIYQIPIGRAMELVAKQYKDNQVTPVSGEGTAR
jgi:hypothetical protein